MLAALLLLLQDPAELVATMPKGAPVTATYEGVGSFFVMYTSVHIPVEMTFRVKPGDSRRADVAFSAPTGAARAAWVDEPAGFHRWTYINDRIEQTVLPGPFLESVRQPAGEKRPPWWAVTPDFAIQLLLDQPLVSFNLDPSLILREPNLKTLGPGVLESRFDFDALSKKSLLYLLPIDRVRCRFFISKGRLNRWELHADGAEVGDGLWQWFEVAEWKDDQPAMIVGASRFRTGETTFGVTHALWRRGGAAGDPGDLMPEAIWRDAAAPGLVSERVEGASKADEAYRRVLVAMKSGIAPKLLTGRFSLEMSEDLLRKLLAEKPDGLVAAVNLADASKLAKPTDAIGALLAADLFNRAEQYDKAAAALDGVDVPGSWAAGAKFVAAAGLGKNEDARKIVTDYLAEGDDVPEGRFWKIAGAIGATRFRAAKLGAWAQWLDQNADSPWAHGVRALAGLRAPDTVDIAPYLAAVKGGKIDVRRLLPYGLAAHAAGAALGTLDDVEEMIEATGEPAEQDAWLHAAALDEFGEIAKPHAAKAWALLKPRIEAGSKTPDDLLTLMHLAHQCYSNAANDEFCALAQACIEKDYFPELLVEFAQAGSRGALGVLTGHLAARKKWKEAAHVLALVRRHRPDAYERTVSRANDAYAGGLIDFRKDLEAAKAEFAPDDAETLAGRRTDPATWGPSELAEALDQAKDLKTIETLAAHPNATFGVRVCASMAAARVHQKENRPVEALLALNIEAKKLRYGAFVGRSTGLIERARELILKDLGDEALASGLSAIAAKQPPLTDEESTVLDGHIRALGVDDVGLRDDATAALKAFGLRASPKLAPLVKSTDPEILARVKEVLRSYVAPPR